MAYKSIHKGLDIDAVISSILNIDEDGILTTPNGKKYKLNEMKPDGFIEGLTLNIDTTKALSVEFENIAAVIVSLADIKGYFADDAIAELSVFDGTETTSLGVKDLSKSMTFDGVRLYGGKSYRFDLSTYDLGNTKRTLSYATNRTYVAANVTDMTIKLSGGKNLNMSGYSGMVTDSESVSCLGVGLSGISGYWADSKLTLTCKNTTTNSNEFVVSDITPTASFTFSEEKTFNVVPGNSYKFTLTGKNGNRYVEKTLTASYATPSIRSSSIKLSGVEGTEVTGTTTISKLRIVCSLDSATAVNATKVQIYSGSSKVYESTTIPSTETEITLSSGVTITAGSSKTFVLKVVGKTDSAVATGTQVTITAKVDPKYVYYAGLASVPTGITGTENKVQLESSGATISSFAFNAKVCAVFVPKGSTITSWVDKDNFDIADSLSNGGDVTYEGKEYTLYYYSGRSTNYTAYTIKIS